MQKKNINVAEATTKNAALNAVMENLNISAEEAQSYLEIAMEVEQEATSIKEGTFVVFNKKDVSPVELLVIMVQIMMYTKKDNIFYGNTKTGKPYGIINSYFNYKGKNFDICCFIDTAKYPNEKSFMKGIKEFKDNKSSVDPILETAKRAVRIFRLRLQQDECIYGTFDAKYLSYKIVGKPQNNNTNTTAKAVKEKEI